ncbi:hypothetical protein P7C70_g1857, partial [Phenoliferia sp. Uapishka_3]
MMPYETTRYAPRRESNHRDHNRSTSSTYRGRTRSRSPLPRSPRPISRPARRSPSPSRSRSQSQSRPRSRDRSATREKDSRRSSSHHTSEGTPPLPTTMAPGGPIPTGPRADRPVPPLKQLSTTPAPSPTVSSPNIATKRGATAQPTTSRLPPQKKPSTQTQRQSAPAVPSSATLPPKPVTVSSDALRKSPEPLDSFQAERDAAMERRFSERVEEMLASKLLDFEAKCEKYAMAKFESLAKEKAEALVDGILEPKFEQMDEATGQAFAKMQAEHDRNNTSFEGRLQMDLDRMLKGLETRTKLLEQKVKDGGGASAGALASSTTNPRANTTAKNAPPLHIPALSHLARSSGPGDPRAQPANLSKPPPISLPTPTPTPNPTPADRQDPETKLVTVADLNAYKMKLYSPDGPLKASEAHIFKHLKRALSDLESKMIASFKLPSASPASPRKAERQGKDDVSASSRDLDTVKSDIAGLRNEVDEQKRVVESRKGDLEVARSAFDSALRGVQGRMGDLDTRLTLVEKEAAKSYDIDSVRARVDAVQRSQQNHEKRFDEQLAEKVTSEMLADRLSTEVADMVMRERKKTKSESPAERPMTIDKVTEIVGDAFIAREIENRLCALEDTSTTRAHDARLSALEDNPAIRKLENRISSLEDTTATATRDLEGQVSTLTDVTTKSAGDLRARLSTLEDNFTTTRSEIANRISSLSSSINAAVPTMITAAYKSADFVANTKSLARDEVAEAMSGDKLEKLLLSRFASKADTISKFDEMERKASEASLQFKSRQDGFAEALTRTHTLVTGFSGAMNLISAGFTRFQTNTPPRSPEEPPSRMPFQQPQPPARS